MSNKSDTGTESAHPVIYQIRVKGHLGGQWFEGMALTLEERGETLITGPVVDQAALYGLLRKVRDLGLPLLSVTRVEPDQTATPDSDCDETLTIRWEERT